jgi:protein-tyrosine phosphatase
MYPGDRDPAEERRKLGALLASGIRTFVSLLEEGELEHFPGRFRPYEPALERLAGEHSGEVRQLRFPVEDMDVPAPATLERALDAIDAEIARSRAVYLHCYGGLGRTGTLVGCWLIRHGRATPGTFADVLAALRAGIPGTSPQTDEQRAFVESWGRMRYPSPPERS